MHCMRWHKTDHSKLHVHYQLNPTPYQTFSKADKENRASSKKIPVDLRFQPQPMQSFCEIIVTAFSRLELAISSGSASLCSVTFCSCFLSPGPSPVASLAPWLIPMFVAAKDLVDCKEASGRSFFWLFQIL